MTATIEPGAQTDIAPVATGSKKPRIRTADTALARSAASDRTGAKEKTRAASSITVSVPVSPEVLLRLAVSLTWLFWSSRFYISTYRLPGATVLTILFGVGGIALFAGALVARRPRTVQRIDTSLLVGAGVGMALWVVSLVYTSSQYGTDEAALTQGAAQMVVNGHNPYGADLSNYLQQFGVSPSAWTTTLNGGYVHDLGYPSLSFLLLTPLLAVGVVSQAQIWLNAVFFILGGIILWRRLPRTIRNIVPLVFALDAYGSSVSSGLIFGIALPFAILAVTRWDRFGMAGEPLSTRRLGPVFLGLACAVRQDLWVLVPFLTIGVALEARATGMPAVRRGAHYLALVAVAFLVPNLPFIVWDPMAWFKGVLSPVLSGLVPLGQGAVGFSLYMGIGGGNLALYSLIVVLAVLAMIPATLVWYDRVKPLLPIIPACVLFLSTRSLAQYMLFGSLVAIAAFATITRPGSTAAFSARVRRRLVAVTAVIVTACGGSAFAAVASHAPLALSITAVRTTGQEGTVDVIDVRVHNVSGGTAEPRFVVGGGPYVGLTWFATTADGDTRIASGATETYHLRAPDVTSMPAISSGFKVYAFTSTPASVSSSSLVTLSDRSTRLTPNSVSRVVPVGDPLDLRVAVVDRFGDPVRKAGIPVELGQAEYTSGGLLAGETVIDGGAVGASPAQTVTDARGVARFHVVAPAPIQREVFFQAWIGGSAPQGYSQQLAVWFGSH